MKIDLIPIDQIRPYEANARFNDETVKSLKKAIQKYGFNQPIVIDTDGVIVKGHARYRAALELGMTELPAIFSVASDEVNRADCLADNMIHDLSEWDDESLRSELRDIEDSVNEVLGVEFQEEYGTGPAFGEVGEADVQSARDAETDRIAKKRELIKLICPDCGEVIFVDKGSIGRLK